LLKENDLEEFYVESGTILSPAAKDYLNQVRVRVRFAPPGSGIGAGGTSAGGVFPGIEKHYVDAQTGKRYTYKPECMTHLVGNKLVYKDHARIVFRGELDHLQSQIVFAQVSLNARYSDALISDLEGILAFVRELLRAEVLDEPVVNLELLGLSNAELREQSHDPEKYFGVKAMTLPHYGMGDGFAHLNLLRSQSRQAECAAVQAFRSGTDVSNEDVVLALNRLSSGFHIMCCRLLSGHYYQTKL